MSLKTSARYMRQFVGLLLISLALPALAQMPDKFTNLQVLPKDISKKELMAMMRGFSFSLGVRCEHCHVEHKFAEDDKEQKRTARTMLRMVDDINKGYIAKLGKTAPIQVQCVTCHHGLPRPQPLNAVLAETIQSKDVQAAIAQYKELRKKYYGGAQYDFGETSLNILSESLLAQDKNKDAVAIMEMNAEVNNPVSGWGLNVLAMSHKANGDLAKAKADFEKIVASQPDNAWAKQQLEELKSTK